MKRKATCITVVLLGLTVVLASPVFGSGKSAGSSGTGSQAGARDLGGIKVVIGNWWADYDVNTFKPTNAEQERTLEWRKKIQKDYNVTIVEKNVSNWDNMPQVASSSIMAGDPAGSIIVLQPSWVLTLYNQNLLYPASDCPSVDFSKTDVVEWNKDINGAFTFNGKTYGFAVGYGTSNHGHGVFFNKRLFREAGIDPETPYNLQKSGQWTWDAFIDLCKKLTRDTNNDGIIDTYALATFSKDTTDAIVVSNGARYFDKDSTGKFVNATGRPEFLQALQFVVRLNREGYLMPQLPNAEWNWFVSAFHDGKAAMRVGPEYVAGELQDMVDDWGFVLFPKGPRVTDYKYNADENVYVIPKTFTPEQADKILYALSLWLTPAPGNEARDAWKGGQYNRYRDARAVDETLVMLRDPKYSMMAYNAFIPGTDTANISDTIWSEGADPAQLIESISQPWNNAVNQVNGVR